MIDLFGKHDVPYDECQYRCLGARCDQLQLAGLQIDVWSILKQSSVTMRRSSSVSESNGMVSVSVEYGVASALES